MESFLDDLKKQVQCSLCQDTLIEPKILKCFHTFCKPCIKRHAELIEEANVFKCPKCLSETCLPELSSVEDLKPSLVHTRILKGLALVESEKVCSVSESHSLASWYCFDCDRSMCPECETSHTVFIKDHKVVRLAAGFKKEDIELIIARENPCKSHPNQRLESFCEDCDVMICLTCLKDDHMHHNLLKLNKFASIKKDVFSKHLELLEKLEKNDKHKQEQENIASIMKQDGEKAKREVKDKTKKMIEILQENERELVRQIDEKLDTANRNLNIIHHIPAVKEYINNVMERGLASEMVNIQETECTEDFMFNPIPRYSRIIFVPNKELMQQVNSGLGEIQTCSKTDHTMSTIQMESEPEALRKKKLILITKTSTGELSVNPSDVVDVKISPEDNVKIEEKYVRTDGKIEIEFMAKVPGQLTAEVQVNRNHVFNSPIVMNVKPQQMRITRKFNMKGVNTGSPRGIAVNKENSRIAVADESAHCVHVFNTDGDLLLTYGSYGSGQGQLSRPEGLAFLNETDLVISDYGNHRICIVNTTTGTLVKTFGNKGNGDGQFHCPYGVHVDDDGNIIVSDRGNHRVQVFTKDGDYQCKFGLTKQDRFDPVSTVTHRGLFYVSDFQNNVIHVFDKKGNVPTRISTIGGEGSADGQLSGPWGLAIDNDHNLLVRDGDNIQKFTLDGRFVGKTCDEIKSLVYIAVVNDGQLLVTSYRTGVFFVN